MVLRGTRPSEDDLQAVETDPVRLGPTIDGWLDSPAFGETIRDLHAELWRFRADSLVPLPSLGGLSSVQSGHLTTSVNEGPLLLVEDIVMGGRPYTEVLTSDLTFVDEVVAAVFQGASFDPAGPEWQRTTFTDGRPAAGLLSQPTFYYRYRSDAFNFHRQRATAIARIFLCTDYEALDSSIDGAVFASDPPPADELERAECAVCHAGLEPIAATLWGFEPHTSQILVDLSYARGCTGTGEYGTDIADTCYPLKYWDPDRVDDREGWGLSAPGLGSAPVADLAALGRAIAEDPRFAECTTRWFYGWFTQTEPLTASSEVIDPLTGAFVDSGFDAKTLVREIVWSPSFRSAARRQIVRPEQLGRLIADLTGYRWTLDPDDADCRSGARFDGCYGEVDLMTTSRFGFRALAGGIDGTSTVLPEHGPTPSRALVSRALAVRAAEHVVATDLAEPDRSARRLLRRVEAWDTDEDVVRAQIVELFRRIVGDTVEVDGPEVDAAWPLFVAGGWELVLTALLDDPGVWFY